MKKLRCLLFIAAFLLYLCACQASAPGSAPGGTESNPSKTKNEQPSESRDEPPSKTEGTLPGDVDKRPIATADIAFQAQYIRTDWNIKVGGNRVPDQVMVIRSVQELEQKARVLGQEIRARYDESYFEKQILIIVLRSANSGSVRHKVTGVSRLPDGQLNISIETKVPEIGTADMAGWHILIEPEAGVDVASARDVLVNGAVTAKWSGNAVQR